jgi:hypothetical protein
VGLIHQTSKNLIQLYMWTNGLDHEGIERKLISILRLMPNLKRLRIASFFDHIREKHERIRGGFTPAHYRWLRDWMPSAIRA